MERFGLIWVQTTEVLIIIVLQPARDLTCLRDPASYLLALAGVAGLSELLLACLARL